MAEKTAVETGAPSDADFTTPSPITFRHAVGPSGDHGYEIGYWQANADPLNPTHFVMLEGVYDQIEAAQRARVLNQQWMAGQVTPMQLREMAQASVEEDAKAKVKVAEPEEDNDDDEEAPHKRGRRR